MPQQAIFRDGQPDYKIRGHKGLVGSSTTGDWLAPRAAYFNFTGDQIGDAQSLSVSNSYTLNDALNMKV